MNLSPGFLEEVYRQLASSMRLLYADYPETSASLEDELAFFRRLLSAATALTKSPQGFIIQAHHQPLLQSPSDWEIISINPAVPTLQALMEVQSYLALNHFNAPHKKVSRLLYASSSLIVPLSIDSEASVLYLEGPFPESETFYTETLLPFWLCAAQLTCSLQERKQILAQLQEATALKEESEMQAYAKAEFLATISHEIRTPMSAVLGMASLLAETSLTEEQHSLVETICSGSSSLLEIINDFLDFSKMEFGKMELDNQPFELKASIEEIFSLFYQKALKKGLRFSFRIDRNIPQIILGDSTRLRQILVNLIENALKFTEYGEITLTVRLADSAQIQPSEPLNNFDEARPICLEFCVRDTGCGIPSDQLQIIFDSFTQAAPTVSRKYGGTGLGLTICSRLAQMMGGKTWVESQIGQGSAFYFSMETRAVPWRSVEIPTIETPASSVFAEQYPMRILVAEDNATNQKFISHVLYQLGYQPTFARTGREVLELLEEQAFELILMDVQMPEMDGLEVTQHILQHYPAGQRPRIIAMTAFGFSDDRHRCLDAGMDDYIRKPISPEQLQITLARWHSGTSPNGNLPVTETGEESVDIPELMARMGNNPKALYELTQLFREDGRHLLQKIKLANQHRDWPGLYQLAHELKGVCATLSIPSMQSIAASLEETLQHGSPDNVGALLSKLEAEFQTVEAIFQQLINTVGNETPTTAPDWGLPDFQDSPGVGRPG